MKTTTRPLLRRPCLLGGLFLVLTTGCAGAGRGAEASAARAMTHQHHTIDYIEFTVSDLAEAKRFYSEAFAWTFTDYGPDYAGIQREGGGEVGGMLQAPSVERGGPLVVLYSEDLEASVGAVRRAGGTLVKEPFAFPGGRRFHFLDPSGNELAVWGE